MSNQLPKTVDPYRLAGTGAALRGGLPLVDMGRLRARLASADGMVDVSLTFGVDADNTRYIQGRYDVTLQLVCQRCMEAMTFPIAQTVKLGLVSGDAERVDRLPARYEPLIIEDDSLDLAEMVEDEILLALPIVPMHEPDVCAVSLEALCGEAPAAEPETHRPFANLSGLMKAQHK